MYYLPHFDKKINYHLYLLIYGEPKPTWYEELIPKFQQFFNFIHDELKNCKCPFLLLITASVITFILSGFIIKILSNLYRSSNQYGNLPLQELLSSESIERNEEFISNSDIAPAEPSEAVIKEEIEVIENIQTIEVCPEPCVRECIFEGYKKMYVFTINIDDLPSNIMEKLTNVNESDCEAVNDQIQPLVIEIIDKALKYMIDKSEHSINEVTNKTEIINSMPTESNNQGCIKLCQLNECHTNKTQPGSKIPLSLKSRQQRHFIKNINDIS